MSRTSTDTAIGIAGAVVLVFTILGVLAYDYNPPVDDDGADAVFNVQAEEYEGTLSSGGFFENTFTPGTGVTGMAVRIDWTPTAPAQLPPLAACAYELLLEDGSVLASGDCTAGASFAVSQPTASVYTIHISAPAPSTGGDYVVQATYDY